MVWASFIFMITYNDNMHILFSIGIAALYKGVGPSVLRTFPATGALFLAYETTKKWMTRAADHYEIN